MIELWFDDQSSMGKRSISADDRQVPGLLPLDAEHELNASTFTTRVITSTNSDMHSAVAGGHGALKGLCTAGRARR